MFHTPAVCNYEAKWRDTSFVDKVKLLRQRLESLTPQAQGILAGWAVVGQFSLHSFEIDEADLTKEENLVSFHREAIFLLTSALKVQLLREKVFQHHNGTVSIGNLSIFEGVNEVANEVVTILYRLKPPEPV